MSRQKIHPIASPYLQALLKQKAKDNASFTFCELRDQLTEQEALAGFDRQTLRLYVRDQINKRVKQGLVECVGLHPGFKHREVFQLTAPFADDSTERHSDTPHATSDVEPLVIKLRRDSEQLRGQIEASDYRLQAFQEIVGNYPNAQDEIAPLFEQEKAYARALGEKLKVYAYVQRQLSQVGGEA